MIWTRSLFIFFQQFFASVFFLLFLWIDMDGVVCSGVIVDGTEKSTRTTRTTRVTLNGFEKVGDKSE